MEFVYQVVVMQQQTAFIYDVRQCNVIRRNCTLDITLYMYLTCLGLVPGHVRDSCAKLVVSSMPRLYGLPRLVGLSYDPGHKAN